jgi:DNA-binding protein HU-beta
MTRTAQASGLLVEAFREHVDVPDAVAQAFCDAVQAKLVAGKKVHLGPLGTFSLSTRARFEGVHPKTGEVMVVPAARIPVFRQAGGLHHALGILSPPHTTKRTTTVLKGIPKALWPDMVTSLTTHLAARLLEGTNVELGSLGHFSLATRKAFVGYNPKTGETMQVPSASLAVFRASPALKVALNPRDGHAGEDLPAAR